MTEGMELIIGARREDMGKMSNAMPPRRHYTQRYSRLVAAERGADKREAMALVQELAEPLRPRERVKEWIGRAADALRWDFARVEDIWRGEARRIDSWEMDALRAAVRARRRAKRQG